MDNQFDEISKSLAQSVTRRAALRKFGVGLAGMALACFGLPNKARAATYRGYCQVVATDLGGVNQVYTGTCLDINGCVQNSSADCPAWGARVSGGGKIKAWRGSACANDYDSRKKCSFTI